MSLSSVSAISQGGFAEGRGQWLVSLRRGFLEYVLAMTNVSDDLDPKFWDALGRVQFLLSDHHMVWGEVLYGGDELVWRDDETASGVRSSWGNGYAWAGWKGSFGDRLSVETMLSMGRLTRSRVGDVDNPNGGAFTPLLAAVDEEASFDFVGAKQDWALDLSESLMFKAVVDARSTSGAYDYFSTASRLDVTDQGALFVRTDTSSVEVAPSGSVVGSYVAFRGRAGRAVTWEAGVRHDWQEHTGDSDFAPRLLMRADLGARTSLKVSLGRYFQSQGLHDLNAKDGERSYSRSERAEQVAIGLERGLGRGYNVRLEAYRRSIDDPHPIFVNLSRAVAVLRCLELPHGVAVHGAVPRCHSGDRRQRQ